LENPLISILRSLTASGSESKAVCSHVLALYRPIYRTVDFIKFADLLLFATAIYNETGKSYVRRFVLHHTFTITYPLRHLNQHGTMSITQCVYDIRFNTLCQVTHEQHGLYW